jgi:hypothetical protein
VCSALQNVPDLDGYSSPGRTSVAQTNPFARHSPQMGVSPVSRLS